MTCNVSPSVGRIPTDRADRETRVNDMSGGWDHDPGGVFSGRVRREARRYKFEIWN